MVSITNNCHRRRRRRRRPTDVPEEPNFRPAVSTKPVAPEELKSNNKRQADLKLIRNSVNSQALNYFSYRPLKTNRKLTTLLLLLVTCFTLNHHCNCQQAGASDFFSSSQAPQLALGPNKLPELGAESRADNLMKDPRQTNALNELVNFLSNYAANNQPINRRPPLMQQQNNNMRPQQQQQHVPSQPLPVATPGNPFLNTQNRQRPIQFPNNNNNNQIFASSSPATPVNYLTLNRLASFANGNQQSTFNQQQQPLQNSNNNRPNNQAQFNNQQQPARQTIPIGIPPRGIQPQRLNNSPLQMRPLASVPLPAISVVQSQMLNKQASGGFAPSGPPPSIATGSGPTNAVVVVQSPSSLMNASADESATTTSATTTAVGNKLPVTNQPETPGSKLPASNETRQSTSTSTTSAAPTTLKSSTDEASQESNWNPVVELNKTSDSSSSNKRNRPESPSIPSLAPSPDIVTVPPGYNPDAPTNQSYDINVSAQMGSGGSGESSKAQEGLVSTPSNIVETPPSGSGNFRGQLDPSISVAPTAVTTIIWSPPPPDAATTIKSSQPLPEATQLMQQGPESTRIPTSSNPPPSRIRDNSLLNDEPTGNPDQTQTTTTAGVVYGKAQARDSKPTAPPSSVQPAPVSGQASFESAVPAQGKPFIQSVQIDNQVRPYALPSTESANRNRSPTPFRPSRPLNGQQKGSGMSIGSGFTITANGSNQTMPVGDIQDYLANQPPILLSGERPSTSGSSDNELSIVAQGGPDPFPDRNGTSSSSSSSSSTSTNAPPAPPSIKIRRPTFRPKPAVPPIRIDSCIVGDDSSCDQSHNERCVTEYGISSCHCKPGFARLSQLRGYCSPISLYQLSMRIERLSDDRKLAYNHTLENPNTEEYQYLEFESVQALAGAFQQTSLARQFMGTKVNKFFERKGKVWANLSVSLELNNLTRSERVQSLVAQELQRVLADGATGSGRRQPLGETTIVLDGRLSEPLSRLADVNECASKDLNDCSKFASCQNEFGGYQCQCLPGYEDKQNSINNKLAASEAPGSPPADQLDRSKLMGRVCLGCSASFCSNRGECSIVDGRKSCKCRANFVGARCDIDSEVLTVAVGGSLVGIVILVITFWCLYVFNRRWKREQQKMDAMSATSGLTFNYVNSSNNSLMSPQGKLLSAPTIAGRSLGGTNTHQMVANYGHKFGAALGVSNGGRGNALAYQQSADQQAIMGSTSSSSSAGSQPMTAAMYQYAAAAAEEAGLLIAPVSNGSSSEQTSPSSSTGNYAGPAGYNNSMLLPGNAYTLSGHHHHHHHQLVVPPHQHHHHHHHQRKQSMAQFNPGLTADYTRTMNASQPAGSQYEGRWRTLQQDNKQLVGYYLSPDMLMNSQQQQQQQQLYASPQRELCIDTGNNKSARRHSHHHNQTGRSLAGNQLAAPVGPANQRARLHRNSSMYIDPEYEHDRRI